MNITYSPNATSPAQRANAVTPTALLAVEDRRPSLASTSSFETLVLLGGDRVLIANDNNYPDSNGRIPGRPDDLEADILDVPGLRK